MAKRNKSGKPQALETEENGPTEEPTLEQFVQALHGESPPNPDGMPPLEWLKSTFQTKSAAIRYLSSAEVPKGPFSVKQISKHMNIRYQMVRNIVNNPLKRGPNEPWRPSSPPPKQEV